MFSSKCLNFNISSKNLLEENQQNAYATVVLKRQTDRQTEKLEYYSF
jgi:hypothetical protein